MTHEHDRGLGHDLPRMLGRRRMLGLLAGAGLATLAGCGTPDGPSGGGGAGSVAQGADGEIRQETAGPFPADGTNGPDALAENGVVRQDIRPSFGPLSGVAEGVPLSIRMSVTDVAGAAPPGAAVYVWHCDQDGAYSLY